MSVTDEANRSAVDTEQAVSWLEKLIGKTLRVHLTDSRMMCGSFKCTDKDRNIILANTHEYRETSPSTTVPPKTGMTAANVSTRYIGLVTIGGEFITKLEVEEFDPSSI